MVVMWSDKDLKCQYQTSDAIEPELRPAPHSSAKETGVHIGEEAALFNRTARRKGAPPRTQNDFLTAWLVRITGKLALKVFIQLEGCDHALRVFRRDVVLPRLFKGRLLPPLIKVIECAPDSKDLAGRVQEAKMELPEHEEQEASSEDELSETEYEREGEVSHNFEDNIWSPDKANGTEKKPEVAKSMKFDKPRQKVRTRHPKQQKGASKACTL